MILLCDAQRNNHIYPDEKVTGLSDFFHAHHVEHDVAYAKLILLESLQKHGGIHRHNTDLFSYQKVSTRQQVVLVFEQMLKKKYLNECHSVIFVTNQKDFSFSFKLSEKVKNYNSKINTIICVPADLEKEYKVLLSHKEGPDLLSSSQSPERILEFFADKKDISVKPEKEDRPSDKASSGASGGFLDYFDSFNIQGTRPGLPFYINENKGSDTVNEIINYSRANKILNIDLGAISLKEPETISILKDLAQLRRENLWGIRFKCKILGGEINRSICTLLKEAGVDVVEIDPGDITQEGLLTGNIRQVRAVIILSENDIKASWKIHAISDHRDLVQVKDLLELIKLIYHVYPPEGVVYQGSFQGEKESVILVKNKIYKLLSKAIRSWATQYMPARLTYARGPGFVRIFDQRKDKSQWRFIVLRGVQAEVFLLCMNGATLTAITEEHPKVDSGKLKELLNALEEAGIIVHSDKRYFQAIAQRRKLEKRWGSADLIKDKINK